MENSATTRETISALADGEVDAGTALQTLVILREPVQRQTWDLYHQIGDTLRSEQMAAPMSEDFSRRFAAKFEAEPPLLAPAHVTRPSESQTVKITQRYWFGFMPAALAAAAAGVLAFVMVPNLMPGSESDLQAKAGARTSVPTSHGALLAEATQIREPSKTAVASLESHADISQYIEVHQNSHTSLYGSARLIQPAALVTTADK